MGGSTVDDYRVVWVLGAGFSVPLGGPLFRDLISERTLRSLNAWPEYANVAVPGVQQPGLGAHVVQRVFASGLGTRDKMNLWADAEQFLDCLDIAANNAPDFLVGAIREELSNVMTTVYSKVQSPTAPLVAALSYFHGDLVGLHQEALRFVAGACTNFLLRAEQSPALVDKSEQWDPYRQWLKKLKVGRDSVITFNYDRALDILGDYGKRQEPQQPVFVSPIHGNQHFEHLQSGCVPVYNLHGHVCWQRSPDGILVQCASSAVAHKTPATAVIGTPGQNKLTLPGKLLKGMWTRAIEAISEANAVVFVGYRFPQTDNMAKRELLDALRKNTKTTVHVVLGANNPDTPRLREMIEWTRPLAAKVVGVHQLYAEDFFAVFERDGLFTL